MATRAEYVESIRSNIAIMVRLVGRLERTEEARLDTRFDEYVDELVGEAAAEFEKLEPFLAEEAP